MPKTNFVHYGTGTNLGDLICSPKHYFSFEHNLEELSIVGGGTLVGHLTGKEKIYPNSVIWGAGSWATAQIPEVGSSEILAWGIRDLSDALPDENFLPCVSALHPMLDIDEKREYDFLYLNADPSIIGLETMVYLNDNSEKYGFKFLTNRATEAEFIDVWKNARRVLTNSYHGAYWSLLSGAEVSIIGHNNKFANLCQSFGLRNKVKTFTRGSAEDLLLTLGRSMEFDSSLRLAKPKAVLEDFRKRQTNFADRLVQKGILSSYALKDFGGRTTVLEGPRGNQAENLNKTYKTTIFQ